MFSTEAKTEMLCSYLPGCPYNCDAIWIKMVVLRQGMVVLFIDVSPLSLSWKGFHWHNTFGSLEEHYTNIIPKCVFKNTPQMPLAYTSPNLVNTVPADRCKVQSVVAPDSEIVMISNFAWHCVLKTRVLHSSVALLQRPLLCFRPKPTVVSWYRLVQYHLSSSFHVMKI